MHKWALGAKLGCKRGPWGQIWMHKRALGTNGGSVGVKLGTTTIRLNPSQQPYKLETRLSGLTVIRSTSKKAWHGCLRKLTSNERMEAVKPCEQGAESEGRGNTHVKGNLA